MHAAAKKAQVKKTSSPTTAKKALKTSKKKISTVKGKKTRATTITGVTASASAAAALASVSTLSPFQSSPVHVTVAAVSTTAALLADATNVPATAQQQLAPAIKKNKLNTKTPTTFTPLSTTTRAFSTTTRSMKHHHAAAAHAMTASMSQFGSAAGFMTMNGTATAATKQSTWTMKNQKGIRKFSAGALPPHEVLSMPALSPTMEQGTIAGWVKKVGDKINPGDVICEVTTDKATVAFEATDEGYLAAILLPAGDDIIQVGKPVAIVVEDEDDVAKFKDYKAGGAATAKPAAAAAEPAAPAAKLEKDISQQKSCGVYIAPESPQAVKIAAPAGGRVAASPLARVTANEMGIDLSQIQGTGMFGEVTQANVLAHKPTKAAAPAAAATTPAPAATKTAAPAAPASGDYVDEALTPMRKVIAQRLTQSKQSIPHYYITVEIEMTQVNKLRAEFNKQLAAAAGKDEKPTKLSVNDFIIKASAAALNKVPDVNSSWQDTTIRRYNYVDISVAVATDAGLITPIIADADLKGLAGISGEMKSLAGRARQGKLQPHEFQGGTFTISNLGMFGVDQFSAIINPPQAAILAIGGTQQKVIANAQYDANVAGSQAFKAVDVMKVTASFDHRVVDGAVGAQFLSELKGYLENPTKLLL